MDDFRTDRPTVGTDGGERTGEDGRTATAEGEPPATRNGTPATDGGTQAPADETPATGDETALITGASAGIGRALARQFAAGGHDLVLVARREDRLRDLAADLSADHGVAATVVPMDLAEPGAAADLHDAVADRDLTVTTLVNNVGVGTYGPLWEVPVEDLLDEVRLNAVLPLHLSRLFLPAMVEAGRGRVLNVVSSAAFQPGPLMAGYYASKAYLLSLSEALAEELRDTGVTVTALCPGPIDTEFQERAGMGQARLATGFLQDIDRVARAGYRGAMASETVVIPGLRFKLVALVSKLAPRSVSRRLAKWVNSER